MAIIQTEHEILNWVKNQIIARMDIRIINDLRDTEKIFDLLRFIAPMTPKFFNAGLIVDDSYLLPYMPMYINFYMPEYRAKKHKENVILLKTATQIQIKDLNRILMVGLKNDV